jgi:hypothetical protein
MRAGMEAITSAAPIPDGAKFKPVDAGGVPGEWVETAGADDSKVILYLHGGSTR